MVGIHVPEEESLLLHLYLEFPGVRMFEFPLCIFLLDLDTATETEDKFGVLLTVGDLTADVVATGEVIKAFVSLLLGWSVDASNLNWELFG